LPKPPLFLDSAAARARRQLEEVTEPEDGDDHADDESFLDRQLHLPR
jgi:hypothetical protein